MNPHGKVESIQRVTLTIPFQHQYGRITGNIQNAEFYLPTLKAKSVPTIVHDRYILCEAMHFLHHFGWVTEEWVNHYLFPATSVT